MIMKKKTCHRSIHSIDKTYNKNKTTFPYHQPALLRIEKKLIYPYLSISIYSSKVLVEYGFPAKMHVGDGIISAGSITGLSTHSQHHQQWNSHCIVHANATECINCTVSFGYKQRARRKYIKRGVHFNKQKIQRNIHISSELFFVSTPRHIFIFIYIYILLLFFSSFFLNWRRLNGWARNTWLVYYMANIW